MGAIGVAGILAEWVKGVKWVIRNVDKLCISYYQPRSYRVLGTINVRHVDSVPMKKNKGWSRSPTPCPADVVQCPIR